MLELIVFKYLLKANIFRTYTSAVPVFCDGFYNSLTTSLNPEMTSLCDDDRGLAENWLYLVLLLASVALLLPCSASLLYCTGDW